MITPQSDITDHRYPHVANVSITLLRGGGLAAMPFPLSDAEIKTKTRLARKNRDNCRMRKRLPDSNALALKGRGRTRLHERSENQLQVAPVIANAPLWEQVYEHLKTAILDARIRPGMVMSTRGLAELVGTSTMPIRDAIVRLSAEKIVELLPKRGIRIAFLDPDQARDIFRVRVALESLAVSLAAERITKEELRDLEKLERELELSARNLDIDQFVRANIRFHLAMYRASHSETIIEMVQNLYLRFVPTLYTACDNLKRVEGYAEAFVVNHHRDILDALAAHDSDRASQALERDLYEAVPLYDLPPQADLQG